MLRLWRTEWFERTPPIEQVDFGNGHQVSAEDLLEGHFRRLTDQSERRLDADTNTAAVRVNNDLHATIRIVAPTLTPLTDLAEEVAQTMPDAGPTPYFRDTLNQALTQTHRQQRAQRILGIRPTEVEGNSWRNLFVVAFALTVLSLGFVIFTNRSGSLH